MQSGHLKSQNTADALYIKYLSSGRSMAVATKTLHQKITATSRKIARYTARSEGFYQNKLFATDQHKFYEFLSSSNKTVIASVPNDRDVVKFKFWTILWGNDRPHNESTSWIGQVTTDLQNMSSQGQIHISTSTVSSAARKLNNWRAPGPDGIHNFWIKHFSHLHPCLAEQIQMGKCPIGSHLAELC